MSQNAWKFYFADSVEGFDQYVWAWKPHFYRSDVFFYDWQYTFGYLVSHILADRLEHDGRTAAGADLREFFIDASESDCDTLLRKHLGANIADADFWDHAITEALGHLV